jgi:hypothetical protein
MDSGIYIRGVLVGTKDGSYRNKAGENVPFKALGVNVPIINSFGFESFITKEIRIGTQKLNDAAFMKSLTDNFNNFVELEIGFGDFSRIYVPNNAVLNVIQTSNQLSKVG